MLLELDELIIAKGLQWNAELLNEIYSTTQTKHTSTVAVEGGIWQPGLWLVIPILHFTDFKVF